MSELDVSLIQDEDVLRRMWQQTEDFGKKKEIRTHMYRLREERLRNLYSPEPTAEAKGCEFTSGQGHVTSFADQNFQSMKSKEVRDAASPPKEFTYRGQDLKEYSNAGWNVESEDSMRDGGATRVKALHATVEGRYDVEGGAGQFAAADSQRRVRTELHDDQSSLVRDENSSSTVARDHVVRTTADGAEVSSSTTSSSTSSKVKQVSSMKYESVPYIAETDREPTQTVHDTNTSNAERVSRFTNRSDYEQSLRRTEVNSGELISRKVEYPDNNTKVIVETRCLPDGTRVTSTRREFHVPAQQTRSEAYHSHNESKSYSMQQRADSKETSSRTTRVVDDRATDIVDSQRNVDDTDFRRQVREYTVTDDDNLYESRKIDEQREVKTNKNLSDFYKTDNYSQIHRETKVNNKTVDQSKTETSDYSQVRQCENRRIMTDADETDRFQQEIMITRDDRSPKRGMKDVHQENTTKERVHKVTKDKKIEEVVETTKNTDQYQTTYQSDYQQKKVSTDWSPTHQAWASTLRSDTPTTTHPSTRASSPGSRTYQSSTSSLRSSVSPDKYRKPSSRGGSPNKIDRFSPTRSVTSDRYSSTHSSYSVTESKTNKYHEKRPPTVQERPRSSTSPEKKPQSFRPSPSPDRKPTQFRTSPSRTVGPTASPTRQSPEKSLMSQHPRQSSPSRTYTPDSTKFSQSNPESDIGYHRNPDVEPHKKTPSPDRKPNYMRPTAASKPTVDDEPSRKSPTKSSEYKKTTKVHEDNYKFLDEETKVHVRNQNITIEDSSPQQKSPSPKRQTPKGLDLSPVPKGRSSSPQKEDITITENDDLYGRVEKTVIDTKITKNTKNITKKTTNDKITLGRETSPTKYDTYDKKKQQNIINESRDATISHTYQNKPTPDEPSHPIKTGPKDRSSPIKDDKNKHTNEFISTERKTEEINRKTVSKDRPRQLITPSSSPTRKPKLVEPEPSTGQSSPTTSVSGFVYFGSPRNERPLITDLDDNDYPENVEPTSRKPDTLVTRRSPSPSKIPCKASSPEKQPSIPKDILPRKSSLKKPSTSPSEPTLASPEEKPPTSFRVSPTNDKPDVTGHKVIKKDQPEGLPTDSPVKPKPPLQRRETYEDRCRKILGMVDDMSTETVTKETKSYFKESEPEEKSPSVSPCDSPAPQDTISFPEFRTDSSFKTDAADFISREIDENVKITMTKKSKKPSKERSPTKSTSLVERDMTERFEEETLSENELVTRKSTTGEVSIRSSVSPEKNTTTKTPTSAPLSSSPTKPIPVERTNISPTRKPNKESPTKQKKTDNRPTEQSPSVKVPGKTSFDSLTSSTITSEATDIHETSDMTVTRTSRILVSPNRDDFEGEDIRQGKSPENSTRERSPNYLRESPEKSTVHNTTKKIMSSKTNTSTTQGSDITKTTHRKDSYVSPTRKSLHQSRASSPTKVPVDTARKNQSSQERKPNHQPKEYKKKELKTSSPTEPTKDVPGYMKSTTSTTFDSLTAENVKNTTTGKKIERETSLSSPATSPTRKPSDKPRTPSPTKMTRPKDVPKKLENSLASQPGQQKPLSPIKPTKQSPSRESPEKVPGYLKSTTATSSKSETTVTELKDIKTNTTHKIYDQTRHIKSPTRSSPDRTLPQRHKESPSRSNDRNESPRRSVSPDTKLANTIPGYMRPTEAVIHKFDSMKISDIDETVTTETINSEIPIQENEIAPKIPGYMRPTEAATHRFEHSIISDTEEIVTSKIAHRKSPEPHTDVRESPIMSPDHTYDSNSKIPGYMRPTEAATHKFDHSITTDIEDIMTTKTTHKKSPEPAINSSIISSDYTKDTTLETPGYMRLTEAATHKFDSTLITDTDETITSKIIHRKSPERTDNSTDRKSSPERKVDKSSPGNDAPSKYKEMPIRSSMSPDKKPSYMKPTASVTSKYETTSDNLHKDVTADLTDNRLSKPLETRYLRTPSPIKKKVTEVTTEFIMSEKEQQILDKVQKSLRKLSPERKEKSPSRERSPTKSTTSLQDLDIITNSETEETYQFTGEELSDVIEEQTSTKTKTTVPKEKPKVQKAPSKPIPRNVSPIKKTPTTPAKIEKVPDSPKSRSISPKKPYSPSERPHSPHVAKGRREGLHSVLTRKPTPASIKIERLPSDIKKTNGMTKQAITVKTTTSSKTTMKPLSSPTSKSNESESKTSPTPKALKEPISPKKGSVTRTTSDFSIKPKKTSPQRMRSKPEIQINDMSQKSPKPMKESKLPNKPKSATALNTSMDEEDFVIDVQQSKSSRENSPDRICPTPVNLTEDVGTPRYPDEVSEPDDDYRRRTYHTIHETESVVDDIVEICEDEELFTKKTNSITEEDDCLLSVTDKVSKFTNKVDSIKKPKETTTVFKDTERRVHSDYVTENLKSDECLLSVSEKVNKFAKGSRDIKDNRSPTRNITDEYDRDTMYQDDYTKLSVNDKAHLFVETAESIKVSKPKPAQKVERPDLSNVDESLKSDECLLSVSDKVNKFVKTAEHFMSDVTEVEKQEIKMKQEDDKIMKQFVDDEDVESSEFKSTKTSKVETVTDTSKPSTTTKVKDYSKPKSKSNERTSTVKITTLRSSEAVKKAKALFENIASIQTKEPTKTTKLTDIGVIKKSSKTDSTTVLHPSVEDMTPSGTNAEIEPLFINNQEKPSSKTLFRPKLDEKPRSSPNRLTAQSPEVPRSKSPMRQSVEVTKHPSVSRAKSPSFRPESPVSKSETEIQAPGYLKPTKTSQLKEDTTKVTEDIEVSTRRGSGKFGVELRRTSVERSTVSSERRRSVDHHQPCIEDIYDLDLLEQMLEKVTGYEQRRRIRAQIRIVKKEIEHVESTNTKSIKKATHVQTSSPRPKSPTKSPERTLKSTPQKTSSPDRSKVDHSQPKTTPYMNGRSKESTRTTAITRLRPGSPEKPAPKTAITTKSSVRQLSPEKKRPVSPTKTTSKHKPNRFNEYATAYMKKVGLNEADKVKFTNNISKKSNDLKQNIKHEKQEIVQEFTTTKTYSKRTSSKDVIEVHQVNDKRSPSPERRQSPVKKHQTADQVDSHLRKSPSPKRKAQSPERNVQSPEHNRQSPERKAQSPGRLYQRTPSPDFKRPRTDSAKESIIKTVHEIEKKIPKVQEEKPSWVTNRNLKKITNETRTFSSKKIESEKPKYRATSPSKVISKPLDVITSSYGPGPLDADGRPLFGIKALRNGATNIQVKGTVIREEFHSRNGGAPEGSVSVTAYSSQPEDLQQLLADQGVDPPSRLHGLSAITTTKKFGGDTGNTYTNVHTKEERACLEQFTHSHRRSDNRVEDIEFDTTEDRRERTDRRGHKMEDKRTVRQSSVKSLTEKFIKTANDSGKTDRSSYPKAGLILRTTVLKDDAELSGDDHRQQGMMRSDSDHSMNEAFEQVETQTITQGSRVLKTNQDRGQGKTTQGKTTRTVTDSGHGRTRTTVTETSQPGRTTRTVRTTTVQEPVVTRTERTERSFLDSSTKVSGVQDILTRMKNADIVIQEGDSAEDSEARALLNKFLGASVLMAGMQGYVQDDSTGHQRVQESTVRSSGGGTRVTSSTRIEELDLDHCWDEPLLKKLLNECTDYEQRRRLRARIRTLMAEQEACANAVTEALGCAEAEMERGEGDAREEEEVTVSSSVRRDSTEKTISSSTTTKTSKVIESMTRPAPKPVSPFAKFRQLEKQNSTNSPNSPKTPQSPGSPSQPYFKFTDPALQTSALTIKERLLQWCRDKTRDYENVKLENFSTSWADGLAFCALLHHFLPDAFDYSQLTAEKRRHNFTLAFKIADEKAGIYPLLDVDDMVAMRKPDWKCVFTYVQSIYRRFKDES